MIVVRAGSRLVLAMSATILLYGVGPSHAQEVALDTLCQRFPQNSRCQEYELTSTREETTAVEVDRNTLCQKSPQNSYCQEEPTRIFKLQLASAGEDDEWIRIEKSGNTLKMLHATQIEDGLISGLFDGALGLIPVPLPFISVKQHGWSDHRTNRVTFKPDSCTETVSQVHQSVQNCTITGTDVIVLPEATDIHAGIFTVEYQEEELTRSVTFRIPPDLESEPASRSVTFGSSSE